MKRWPLGFLLVLALSAHAESFWDGNAAVQPGDAAFASGLFALSNAFARDTEIVIEDRATGKTTTARVVGRLDGRLDILVLLSPAAALPLGLAQGEIASVRVTVKQPTPAETASILSEDTAPSRDPDRLLPAATGTAPAAGEPTVAEAVKTGAPAQTVPAAETVKTSETAEPVEAAAKEPPLEALADTAEAPAEDSVAESAAEAAAATEAPAEEAPAEAAAPAEETVASTEDSDLLAGLAARSPQKQLFLPPREDEMFAYQEPVEPPAELPLETVEVAEQPSQTAAAAVEVAGASAPEIASDAGPSAPVETTEPVALAEAQPPAELLPELVETLAAAAPEPEAEPARPLAVPEAVAAEAPEATAVAKPVEAPVATVVEKPAAVLTVLDLPGTGAYTWYLQLAAYSTETLAKETAARLTPTYPVLVLTPPAGSKPLYRVIVGPLNKAESGTLLTYFRHRGFPDAFVRTAQK